MTSNSLKSGLTFLAMFALLLASGCADQFALMKKDTSATNASAIDETAGATAEASASGEEISTLGEGIPTPSEEDLAVKVTPVDDTAQDTSQIATQDVTQDAAQKTEQDAAQTTPQDAAQDARRAR